MNYTQRHLENVVLSLSESWPVLLLTGPRQAAKQPYMREMAKAHPQLFLQLHKPPVLIDEAQYAPELFTYIKIQIDEHRNTGDFWQIIGAEGIPFTTDFDTLKEQRKRFRPYPRRNCLQACGIMPDGIYFVHPTFPEPSTA